MPRGIYIQCTKEQISEVLRLAPIRRPDGTGWLHSYEAIGELVNLPQSKVSDIATNHGIMRQNRIASASVTALLRARAKATDKVAQYDAKLRALEHQPKAEWAGENIVISNAKGHRINEIRATVRTLFNSNGTK